MAKSAAVDRAFELAKSGLYRSVSEVIRHLKPDDRPAVEAHLAQPEARRELIVMCSNAWLDAQ